MHFNTRQSTTSPYDNISYFNIIKLKLKFTKKFIIIMMMMMMMKTTKALNVKYKSKSQFKILIKTIIKLSGIETALNQIQTWALSVFDRNCVIINHIRVMMSSYLRRFRSISDGRLHL